MRWMRETLSAHHQNGYICMCFNFSEAEHWSHIYGTNVFVSIKIVFGKYLRKKSYWTETGFFQKKSMHKRIRPYSCHDVLLLCCGATVFSKKCSTFIQFCVSIEHPSFLKKNTYFLMYPDVTLCGTLFSQVKWNFCNSDNSLFCTDIRYLMVNERKLEIFCTNKMYKLLLLAAAPPSSLFVYTHAYTEMESLT